MAVATPSCPSPGAGTRSLVPTEDVLAQVKQHSPEDVLAQVKQQLMPVEKPLLAEELEALDVRLATGEKTLFWNHEGTNPHLGRPRILLVHFGPQHLPTSHCPEGVSTMCLCAHFPPRCHGLYPGDEGEPA